MKFYLKSSCRGDLKISKTSVLSNKFQGVRVILLFNIPYFMLSCRRKLVRTFQDLFDIEVKKCAVLEGFFWIKKDFQNLPKVAISNNTTPYAHL